MTRVAGARSISLLALLTAAVVGAGAADRVAGLSASQQATFSTRVEAVRVDVLVTDRGRPVRGLAAGDFEILDNGVPQQVEFASFEQIPLNVVMVLDMSASVVGERLTNLRAAGRAVLQGLKPADQAGLITFNEPVMLQSRLTTDVGPVRQALDVATADGRTSLIDAVYTGMMLGESDAGRSLVVVFSDGLDTSSWLSARLVLETARRTDVVVYSVWVGGQERLAFLRDLSQYTGGTLVEAASTKNLDAIFLSVLDEFRQRYLLSYSPRGVAAAGWHQLEVRVRRRNVTIKARPGYVVGPTG